MILARRSIGTHPATPSNSRPPCITAAVAYAADVGARATELANPHIANAGVSQRSALCDTIEKMTCGLLIGTALSSRLRNCTAPAITRDLRENSSLAVADPFS